MRRRRSAAGALLAALLMPNGGGSEAAPCVEDVETDAFTSQAGERLTCTPFML